MVQKPSKFAIFCDLTSIRGFQRIKRAQTPFIRMIWTLFVILMTGALIVTIGFLARDFFSFTTSWHSRTLIDDKTDFPAITICAHNPFSLEANRIWAEASILTPTEFNRQLSAMTLAFIENGNPEYAGLLLQDSTDTYFANLRPEESQRLGHQTTMFPHCMVTADGVNIVAENCMIEGDTGFTKKRFSHPKYFNCWTIETAANQSTKDTVRLTVLLSLIPSKEINESRKNFIMDTFSRGEGVKLVVHQSGTYPEIDKHGINVQPGRMNELSFNTEWWVRLKTPTAPCLDDPPPITDMGRQYSYRMTQCLDSYLQNISINQCGCLNSEWPRPIHPDLVNSKIPYCSALPKNVSDSATLEGIIRRLNCTSNLLHNLKKIKESAILNHICTPRCSFFTYPISASITSWQPIPEKLQHFTDKFKRVERLLNNYDDPLERERLIQYLKEVIDPQEKLSTQIISKSSLRIEDFQNQGSYTYISLVRTTYDTTYKEERLIFDIYILISRVGGLCSIFIGLTAAIIVELIEFVYVGFWLARSDSLAVSTKTDTPELPVGGELLQPKRNYNEAMIPPDKNFDENKNQRISVL
ncbi:unnamed protein product [Mesocestoides corti]|uniref:Amiloride-sensitive sodium channel n=1 Tax=Mesocestoides corti TaxID=53468 RepID=A0A0R3UEW8_MESCO|nr:unnamed protein product [Mesocestoides corti]